MASHSLTANAPSDSETDLAEAQLTASENSRRWDTFDFGSDSDEEELVKIGINFMERLKVS